ncbi:MAG: sodium/proton-translocating pyrophosphatase, partial [Candidatus Lokiarchaeota archaeon]
MLLGLTLFLLLGDPAFIIFNLTLISVGLYSLYFTTLFLKLDLDRPSKSIWKVFIAAILFNVGIVVVVNLSFFGFQGIFFIFSSLLGLLSGFLAIISTTYFTRIEYSPTRKVAASSKISPSVTIISGLSAGFRSVFAPIIIFGLSVVGSYFFGLLAGSSLSIPTTDVLG